MEIRVPRHRNGSFEPVLVPKRKRRLGRLDSIILSLYSRGLTQSQFKEHLLSVGKRCRLCPGSEHLRETGVQQARSRQGSAQVPGVGDKERNRRMIHPGSAIFQWPSRLTPVWSVQFDRDGGWTAGPGAPGATEDGLVGYGRIGAMVGLASRTSAPL